MHLNKLNIVGYKNIEQAELEFSPRINCFVGNNGEGKTNLLDAVYYLSFCKSHSNAADAQNVNHQADFFVLQGSYTRREQPEEIYCALKRNHKKVFKRNGKEYERLADHVGLLPLVLVSPADIALIAEGSDERRKFIDGAIAQYDKPYLACLLRYHHAVNQRNALLKNRSAGIDSEMLELYEAQMVENGEYLHARRTEFVRDFLPAFQEIYTTISEGKERVGIRYRSQLQKGDFREQLERARDRDRLLGFSTCGAHKDELEFLIDEYLIKRLGSQGQNKTFLIALKLAQFDFLKRTGGVTPLLLLDDLFDKLDSRRVSQIVRLVSDPDHFGQIFITDTNRQHLDEILEKTSQEYKIIEVKPPLPPEGGSHLLANDRVTQTSPSFGGVGEA